MKESEKKAPEKKERRSIGSTLQIVAFMAILAFGAWMVAGLISIR
jgi:hypothetical protein